jgi:putative ABC transport system ATP-binding protein
MRRQYIIECNSLSKEFRKNNRIIKAVTDVNLIISHGEFVLLKGRSGAGKSTLLNLVAGLIRPSSGTVSISGEDITRLGNGSLSRLLLEKIGFVFQSLNLLPGYTVFENIELALIPTGLAEEKIKALSLPLLEQFGLADKMHMLPDELSVGQQQKVAIVRTLVKRPSIILADEPTASVDEETAGEIISTLVNLKKNGNATVIVATHGMISDSVADRIIELEEGRIKK